MEENSFTMLRRKEYFIDKSLSLRDILDGGFKKYRFTRPHGWGKTTFQHMMREFLSMSVDKKGEEIEKQSFDFFENLKVVTEDRINIKDLLFLLRNYGNQITEINEEIIDYFCRRHYPWFIGIYREQEETQTQERIQRLYAKAREGLCCTEEELKKMSEQQITDYIENLRVNSPNDEKYFKLLSTFGETCKHYKKYPTIFVQLPEVFELQLSPTSLYNVGLETQIKDSITKAFKTHDYQLNYLKAEIQKNNYSIHNYELKQFESYLSPQADPTYGLEFLSQSLFSRYKIPIVMIVDDYDKPMNHAFFIGETRYQQVTGCITSMLTCIKNEESILYASLTGVNRLTFYDLNNLKEDNILDLEHSDSFGFTASDVNELVRRQNQKKQQNQLDYEELKQWYKNDQIDGFIIFNSHSIIQCLLNKGLLQPHYSEQSTLTMILEFFKKVKVEKEKIAECLLQGEAWFNPEAQYSYSWDEMKKPTSSQFFSFLIHQGYLSPGLGEKVNGYDTSKFVVPNQEIRNLIDTKLMVPFYEMILETKCTPLGRGQIVKSAGTNEFIKNLNENCLKNILILGNQRQDEDFFKSVIFGIFFLEHAAGIYYVNVQKTLNRRVGSVFYPGKLSGQRVAVLHEYTVCWANDSPEEITLDPLWQCLTRNNLKCVSDGKIIINSEESNWDEVKLRGIVFYKNQITEEWCVSSVEYTLSLQEIKNIMEIFSCFEKKENEHRGEMLSGKYTKRVQIEKERALFLKEHKAESLSALIKSVPFCYQQTPSNLKIKAGFSSVKLDYYSLSTAYYPPFEPSKIYHPSAVNSWRLQDSNNSSFKVLDISSYFSFRIIILFVLYLTQQRSCLLKVTPLMRSLKLLSKVL